HMPECPPIKRAHYCARHPHTQESPTGESILDKLPEVLLHQLFDHTPSSIMNLKMVCHTLRQIVERYIQQARTVLLIDKIEVCWSKKRVIRIFVPTDKSDLFELRLKHFVISAQFSRSRIMRYCKESHMMYFLDFKKIRKNSEGSIIDRLNACLGGVCSNSLERRSTTKFVFEHQFDERCRGIVRKILRGLNIYELRVECADDEDCAFICQLIEAHAVDAISLTVFSPTISDPGMGLGAIRCFAEIM
ncbi:hypothetical protein PMAYCL1PPCAC_20518, partial [Pristionchus mayeri]